MKTIYLVRKMSRYNTAPTNIRAFEAMEDAEDLIDVLRRAGNEDIEVVPLELSPARTAVEPLLELLEEMLFADGPTMTPEEAAS